MGFREKESLIYIMLLSSGPNVVTNIAKKIQLPRSTTYNIITDLLKKGILIQRNTPTNQQVYLATPPHKLIAFLHSRRDKIEMQIRNMNEAMNRFKKV